MSNLSTQLRHWRRDFHRHPELAFREYRTAARVCEILSAMPHCILRVGADAVAAHSNARAHLTASADRADAIAKGASPTWVGKMGDGLTAVIAEWRFQEPGPTVTFRVDMDALPIGESASREHFPVREGFASCHPERMHACGHDGHTAVGLGLASIAEQWASEGKGSGRLRILFQPAEEGCGGAHRMISAGAIEGVDYFIAGHLGLAALETGLISCGTEGFLATTKLDVTLAGVAAHAGLKPHEGRNALLAAASLTLQLHGITRHGDGDSRVHVGALHAGTGRNVVANRAEIALEVRGSTTLVNDFMTAEARRIISGVALAYGVDAHIAVAGCAPNANCDIELKQIVREAAASLPQTRKIVDSLRIMASEDATCFMQAVQARGGKATYVLIGAALAAGHHQSSFDFDEAALLDGVELYAAVAEQLLIMRR